MELLGELVAQNSTSARSPVRGQQVQDRSPNRLVLPPRGSPGPKEAPVAAGSSSPVPSQAFQHPRHPNPLPKAHKAPVREGADGPGARTCQPICAGGRPGDNVPASSSLQPGSWLRPRRKRPNVAISAARGQSRASSPGSSPSRRGPLFACGAPSAAPPPHGWAACCTASSSSYLG